MKTPVDCHVQKTASRSISLATTAMHNMAGSAALATDVGGTKLGEMRYIGISPTG